MDCLAAGLLLSLVGMPEPTDSVSAPDEVPRPGRMRPSIAVALMAGFGGLIFLAVAGVLTLGIWTAGENTRDLLADKAEIAAATLVGEIERRLGAVRDGNTYLADLIIRGEVDAGDVLQLTDTLTAAMAAAPRILGMGYFSADFEAIRVTRSGAGFGIRLDNIRGDKIIGPAVIEARGRAEPYWGAPVWAADPGATLITLSTPLHRRGKFIGLLTAVMPVAVLSRSLAAGPLRDLVPDRFVLYGTDHVLAHRSMADGTHARSPGVALPTLGQVGDPILASIWRTGARERVIEILEGATRGHVTEVDGKLYTFSYRSLDGYGPKKLIVGAYVRPGPERDREIERVILAAAGGLAILIVSVLAALWGARRISRPVLRLAAAARGVGTMEAAELPALPRSVFRELDDAALAFNDMRAALKWFATYVPKKLVARLVARGEGGRVVSEERRVTVLFTDIVGFTGLSEKLGAADTARLLNEHFSLLATCVDSEGGIIGKFIGDSLMAFWGPPLGDADHAAGACRAAVAMRETLRRFNERRRLLGAPPIRIRIGIHTGPAIVGNIGSPGHIGFTVVGDTVDLAQRLEQMAKTVAADGADRDAVILLSSDVVNELDGPLALLSLGVREVPGRDQGLMVFRLK